MNGENKNKIFLAGLLIVSLVAFNSPVLSAIAEDGEETDQTSSGNETGDSSEGDEGQKEETVESSIEESTEQLQEEVLPDEGAGQQIVSGNSTGEPEEQVETEGEDSSSTVLEMGGGGSDTTTTEETSTNTETSATTTEMGGEENGTSSEEVLGEGDVPEVLTEPECEGEDCVVSEVASNTAEITNETEGEANTGENTAANTGDGDAMVFTGNAGLVVGVMNTANSNVTDSDFSHFLFNLFGATAGDLNISDQLNPGLGGEPGATYYNIVSNNSGMIDNSVIINALTGANAVTTDSGLAIINTGSAGVAVDIFNILNSNVIGTNWTKYIINVFDDWVGDLIMPGQTAMQAYSEQQGSPCGGGSCASQTTDSNEGGIHNEVSVTVDTGQNSIITRDGNGYIFTGDAQSDTQISNVMNSNIQGGNWFFMAVNNYGEWSGNIYSLPPGFEIAGNGGGGVKIYNMDEDELGEAPEGDAYNVVQDNSGFINNSVMINVSTGGNTAETNGGTAVINTGSASAMTDILNILNSNVTGANWLSIVINIFGSWQGDLAFGRPDLWLGESAVTSYNPVGPGKSITYTLSYRNNGDAAATGVVLRDDFNENHLSVTDAGGGTVIGNPGEIEWDIGMVPAGGTGSVSYTAQVGDSIPTGYSYLTNQSNVGSYEEDWNNEDNSDSLTVQAYKYTAPFWFLPKLEIKKVNNAESPITGPANIDYKITLVNNSDGPANDVVVEDNLKNENSDIVNTYSWDLGLVYPREKIVIDYTVAIGEAAAPGFYINYAQASGVGQKGNAVTSELATSTIEVAGERPTTTGEFSLDDIQQELEALMGQITIIRQEVERIMPEEPTAPEESQMEAQTPEPESGQPVDLSILGDDNPEGNVPPTGFSQYVNLGGLTTENQTSGQNVYLAAASQAFSHSSAKYILSALGFALWLWVAWVSFFKAYAEAENQDK